MSERPKPLGVSVFTTRMGRLLHAYGEDSGTDIYWGNWKES